MANSAILLSFSTGRRRAEVFWRARADQAKRLEAGSEGGRKEGTEEGGQEASDKLRESEADFQKTANPA